MKFTEVDFLLSEMCFREPWAQAPSSESPCIRRFQCTKCGRSYTSKRSLNRHVQLECDKEPQFIIPVTDFLLPELCFSEPGTQAPESDTRSTRRFQCTKCGKSYRQKRSLNRHVNLECDKKPQFSCPYCPHRTKQKCHLQQHIISRHLHSHKTVCKQFLKSIDRL